MRILISYDGSDQADAALRDLRHAGLPGEAEVILISTADSLEDGNGRLSKDGSLFCIESVEKAAAKARVATEMLRTGFPKWKLRVNLAVGSATRVIVKKAHEWDADLIVVGALKQSWINREIFGAPSLRIASETRCAIRVAANQPATSAIEANADPEHRILICVDESRSSRTTVQAVAARVWPRGTEARLLTVVDPFDYTLVPLLEQKIDRVKRLHKMLSNELDYTPLYVSSEVREGEPEKAILEFAESWEPTAIFIGTRERRGLRPISTRSLAHSIIARAKCPVELVKRSDYRSLRSWFRSPDAILELPTSRESV